MSFDDSLRDAPRIEKGDYTYIVHPLLDGVPRVTADLLEEWLEWGCIQPMLDEATLLVAPEAMALPLAAILTLETGIPYTVGRKRSYGLPGERVVPAQTGYHQQTLHLNDIQRGDHVVVIDDVLSTGGTLRAVLRALQEMDGEVVGVLVAIDKGEARQDIANEFGVPVLAMRRVKVAQGRVHVSKGD